MSPSTQSTRRLKLFGHVARADKSQDHSRALRTCILHTPKNWKRRLGRPGHTWLRTVETDLRPFNLGLASGFKKAQDRTTWRALTGTAMSPTSPEWWWWWSTHYRSFWGRVFQSITCTGTDNVTRTTKRQNTQITQNNNAILGLSKQHNGHTQKEKTRLRQVRQSQETERVYSFNTGARTLNIATLAIDLWSANLRVVFFF